MWTNRPMIYPALSSILVFSMLCFTEGSEEILLDTRLAMSDLGWEFSAHSKWQEMSNVDADDQERRVFMVCEVTKKKNDNWLRSQYIEVKGAQRVYVEIAFSMRSCDGVENVATCKETFNLYYYETDSDEGTSTYPPWNEQTYIKVDTIAADIRWSKKEKIDFQKNDFENVEVRGIGPLTKRGFYLAIQDTGSCISLNYIRVYYEYCDQVVRSLATFDRTITGPALTSLVETKGRCVSQAVPTDLGKLPSLYCDGKGNWTMPLGFCRCLAGFEPNDSLSTCEACKHKFFKSSISNDKCKRCPSYSVAENEGMTQCACMQGYFRAPKDDAGRPCYQPPNKPLAIESTVNETSATLTWKEPIVYTADPRNLSYNITCLQCHQPDDCRLCSDHVRYHPSKTNLKNSQVLITQLQAHTTYNIRIYAINDVTDVAERAGFDMKNFVDVEVTTEQAAPAAVTKLSTSKKTQTSFTVSWNAPSPANGLIEKYEVVLSWNPSSNELSPGDKNERARKVNYTTQLHHSYTDLDPATTYYVKVRAKTTAGYGPFSTALPVATISNAKLQEPQKVTPGKEPPSNAEQEGTKITLLAIIVGGALLLIAVIVVVVLFIVKRSRPKKSSHVNRHETEKQPFFNGNSIVFGGAMYQPNHKTYIDPTTYEDPNRAVRDFTKEIDATYVKIEQVIGGGEFGEVCRGRLQLPGKNEHDVAIKTLKSGYSTQQKLDFLGEASIMGQFEHPNVIRLEGVVTRSRPLMIITEFMENGSLDSFLRTHDNEFTVVQLVGMLRNVAAGMKYLSDMGYVHRDLAARNILVNAQLICKVSDFGMSRVLEDDTDVAYTTRHGGKIPIRWTAPEAFTFRKFTSASDVWSFGIVMWEVMSYGERPYWGMSNRDVMNAVETGYRLPAPMDCPQVQHALMLESWKKDRNQRPKFSQIVQALDKMLRDPSQLKVKAGHERKRNSNGLNNSNPVRHDFNPAPAPRTIAQPHHQVMTVGGRHPAIGGSNAADSGFNDEDSEEEKNNHQAIASEHSSLGDFLEVSGMGKYKESFAIHERVASDDAGASTVDSSSVQQPPVMIMEGSESERSVMYSHEPPPHPLDHSAPLTEVTVVADNEECSLSGTLPTYSESHRLTGIPV